MKITDSRQANKILHSLRTAAGYNRPELAQRLNISPATLLDRESGRRGLSVDALTDTAAEFGLDVALVPRGTTIDPYRVIPLGEAQTLGGLLRHLRHQAQLSLNDLAQRIGITKGGLGNRETDAKAMTVAALTESLDALGYDIVAVRRVA